MSDARITRINARGIPVRGNDIDTDRIIPARYLRCVTFEGLGEHPFEDDRQQDPNHPFNRAAYQGAGILIANDNFGCGSSREHAPQSLMRWGVQAVLAESFAEIFFGNCLALGIPCATLAREDVEAIMAAVEADPTLAISLDVEDETATAGGQVYPAHIQPIARHQFLGGSWDTVSQLLEAKDQIVATAERLPYLHFA